MSYNLRYTTLLIYVLAVLVCHVFAGRKKIIRGDGIDGNGIILLPGDGKYSNTVVWLHGLGDASTSWANTMFHLGIADTKFILPFADQLSVSINRGALMPAWSDLIGLSAPAKEDKAGLEKSRYRIEKIIARELQAAEVRVVLGGFSQGGALALHTALRFNNTPSLRLLAGCIALSSWLPLPHEYPAALSLSVAATGLPLLQIHGDSDRVVSYQWAAASQHILADMMTHAPAPIFETIQGLGHHSNAQVADMIRSFLDTVLIHPKN